MKRYLLCILILSSISCQKDKSVGFFKSGEKKFEVPIVDGKYHGEYIKYYPNGNVEARIYYREGNINGYYITYDSSGNQENIVTYKNGIQDGLFKIFYPKTGQEKVVGYFNEGKPDSLGFEYHPDGDIKAVYYYDMGELVYFKAYDSIGNLVDSKITVNVRPKDTMSTYLINTPHEVFIELKNRFSYGKRNRIGIIIGNLDKENNLIDTLEVLGTKEGVLYYQYDTIPFREGEHKISGKLYEIKMPEQEIIGETFFRYKYYVEENIRTGMTKTQNIRPPQSLSQRTLRN